MSLKTEDSYFVLIPQSGVLISERSYEIRSLYMF